MNDSTELKNSTGSSCTSLLRDLLWGNSIALAWTWGFGTYLSIQVALMFGLYGLIAFSLPNAFGLAFFGIGVHYFSSHHPDKHKKLISNFYEKTQKWRHVFIAFQFLALSINAFGFIRYVAIPLGYSPFWATILLSVIPALLFWSFCARTSRIKYVHALLSAIIFPVVFYMICKLTYMPREAVTNLVSGGLVSTPYGYFFGWCIASVVVFLFAPWLDIQHWQRVIQIREERGNICRSYLCGGILFFLIIFFHGCLALYLTKMDIHFIAEPIIGDLSSYRLSAVTSLSQDSFLGASYLLFLILVAFGSIVSSLTSLRWYFQERTDHSSAYKELFVLYFGGITSALILALLNGQLEIYSYLFTMFLFSAYLLGLQLLQSSEAPYLKHSSIYSILYGNYLSFGLIYIRPISTIVLISSPLVLFLMFFYFKKYANVELTANNMP
jgi:hypothetical protein